MNFGIYSFLAFSFVIAITPGPSVVYVVSYSLRYGTKAGIISTLGINSGSIIAIIIAAFGLSSILTVYPNAITVIQTVGGLYVMYLALRIWPKGEALGVGEKNLTERNYGDLFKNGFITSILNPKDIMFYTAFIPAFIPKGVEGGAYQGKFLILGFLYMSIGFITKSTFSIFAGLTKTALNSHYANLVNYVSAIFLFSLGVFLVAKSTVDLYS